ncbi:alcohol dehydrogenase catalytic domain-containing protein [bacterium 210820-DFI.6.37]|nr:alcohol dehydrogenase catalytic domain-containing protein [bacterium 210820-DFI.6.37]
MKAAILKEWKKLELEETPMPWPQANDVIIRVAYAGLCGSDKKIFHGQHSIAKLPIILSHEISGVIWERSHECGRNDLKRGDLVAVRPILSCKTCSSCRAGKENICETVKVLGIHEPGGFAEFIKAPAELVYKLPKKTELAAGALAEPVADALHHIYQSGFQIGDRIAVIGSDFTGLLIAYLLNYTGAARAVVIDDSKYAHEAGRILKLEVSEPSSIVSEDTRRFGADIGEFDIIYESTGTLLGYRTMLRALKLGGRGVVTGVPVRELPVDIKQIFMKELSIIGCRLHNQKDFVCAISLLEKTDFTRPLLNLVTKQMGMRELVSRQADLFSASYTGKAMIQITGEEELWI